MCVSHVLIRLSYSFASNEVESAQIDRLSCHGALIINIISIFSLIVIMTLYIIYMKIVNSSSNSINCVHVPETELEIRRNDDPSQVNQRGLTLF